MTEQTMIERIARALCERECADWDAGDFNATKGGELPEEQREYYMDMARAALEGHIYTLRKCRTGPYSARQAGAGRRP